MTDPIEELQKELRQSRYPVSAFMLIKSKKQVELMDRKLRILCSFGATPYQIDTIVDAVSETLRTRRFDDDVYLRFELQYEIEGELRKWESCVVRSIPKTGFDVEITLPGIIASTAPGFIDNKKGF